MGAKNFIILFMNLLQTSMMAALAAGLMVDHNHKTLSSEESLFVKCGWMLHIWVWWWT